MPSDLVRTLLAAAQDRALRLRRDAQDFGETLPEKARDSGERPGRADAGDERVDRLAELRTRSRAPSSRSA